MKRCLILHVGTDPDLSKLRSGVLERWNTVDCTPGEAISSLLNYDFDLVILCHSIGAGGQARLVRYIGTHFYTMPIVLISDLNLVQSPQIHVVTPHCFDDLKQVLETLLEQGNTAA